MELQEGSVVFARKSTAAFSPEEVREVLPQVPLFQEVDYVDDSQLTPLTPVVLSYSENNEEVVMGGGGVMSSVVHHDVSDGGGSKILNAALTGAYNKDSAYYNLARKSGVMLGGDSANNYGCGTPRFEKKQSVKINDGGQSLRETPPRPLKKRGKLSCPHCHLQFQDMVALDVHQGIHFKCRYCGRLCGSAESLGTHEMEHSSGREVFVCAKCLKTFILKGSWEMHSKICGEKARKSLKKTSVISSPIVQNHLSGDKVAVGKPENADLPIKKRGRPNKPGETAQLKEHVKMTIQKQDILGSPNGNETLNKIVKQPSILKDSTPTHKQESEFSESEIGSSGSRSQRKRTAPKWTENMVMDFESSVSGVANRSKIGLGKSLITVTPEIVLNMRNSVQTIKNEKKKGSTQSTSSVVVKQDTKYDALLSATPKNGRRVSNFLKMNDLVPKSLVDEKVSTIHTISSVPNVSPKESLTISDTVKIATQVAKTIQDNINQKVVRPVSRPKKRNSRGKLAKRGKRKTSSIPKTTISITSTAQLETNEESKDIKVTPTLLPETDPALPLNASIPEDHSHHIDDSPPVLKPQEIESIADDLQKPIDNIFDKSVQDNEVATKPVDSKPKEEMGVPINEIAPTASVTVSTKKLLKNPPPPPLKPMPMPTVLSGPTTRKRKLDDKLVKVEGETLIPSQETLSNGILKSSDRQKRLCQTPITSSLRSLAVQVSQPKGDAKQESEPVTLMKVEVSMNGQHERGEAISSSAAAGTSFIGMPKLSNQSGTPVTFNIANTADSDISSDDESTPGTFIKDKVIGFLGRKISNRNMLRVREELMALKRAGNYFKLTKTAPITAGLVHDMFCNFDAN